MSTCKDFEDCKKTVTTYDCEECAEKLPSKCVIYNPVQSGLLTFLGISTNTSLETILERINDKLELVKIPTYKYLPCFKTLTGIEDDAVFSDFLMVLQQYICSLPLYQIKVSNIDNKPAYLADKIVVGDCLEKCVDVVGGIPVVRISLDFDCICEKLKFTDCGVTGTEPTTITISANTLSICGVNKSTLTATTKNCSSGVEWYNSNDVKIGVGSTIEVGASGVYYAKCGTVKSNLVTVVHTGNCSPDCVSINTVTIVGESTAILNTTQVYTATVTGTAPHTYLWSVTGGATIVGANNLNTVTVTYSSTGTSVLSLIVTNACSTVTATKTVTVTTAQNCVTPTPPVITASPSAVNGVVTVCDSNVTLTATGCTSPNLVSWYNSSNQLIGTGSTLVVTTSGTYYAKCTCDTLHVSAKSNEIQVVKTSISLDGSTISC